MIKAEHPAVEHLRHNQRQLDADGIQVGVSRQALDETLARIAKLEHSENQLVGERDAAEEALSQAYYLVTGCSPKWSNKFGISECLEDIDDAQTVLRKSFSRIAELEADATRWREVAGELAKMLELSRATCLVDCGPVQAEFWSCPRIDAALTAYRAAMESGEWCDDH